MNLNQNITDYIHKASEEQSEILEHLRQIIHESVDGVTEEIKWGFPVFCNNKDFTYLRFSKKHVTLGFYNPDLIKDPDSLLEGSGKTLKHIKIREMGDINDKLLKEWLRAVAK